jgi:hypothetical protein
MKARYRRGLARKGNNQLYAATLGALTCATSSITTAAETPRLAHVRRFRNHPRTRSRLGRGKEGARGDVDPHEPARRV